MSRQTGKTRDSRRSVGRSKSRSSVGSGARRGSTRASTSALSSTVINGDEDDGNRRSRRVTKGKKLAWWKGERPVYDGGRMIGLLTANPTPQKKAKSGGGRLVKGNGNGFSKRVLQGDDEGIVRLVKTEEQLMI